MRRLGLALLCLAGCGSDPESPEPAEQGVVVVFRPGAAEPPLGDVGFPSDLYRDADGVRAPAGLEQLATAGHDSIRLGLEALDGFGRSTAAMFRLDGAPDPDAGAEAFFVDLESGRRVDATTRFYPSLGYLSVLPIPGHVLAPGVRHAVVLSGAAYAPDAELVRIRKLSAAERTTPAEELHGDALDQLVELGAIDDRRSVDGLGVFTTSRQAEELAALADELRSEAGAPELLLDPALAAPYTAIVFGTETTPSLDDWLGIPTKDETGREWPGGDNPTGIAHDAIGAIASGAFVATSFLDPVSGHFERDADGAIRVGDPAVKIPVTIVIPKAPAPASGYPVVVNGHGLSNNRGSMLALANEFARAGFVTIGIDDVEHGARLGIADVINNSPGTYDGPDGIPDEMSLPLTFFAGLEDFVAIRDNLRQTVLDQVSLVRLVKSPALDLTPLGAAAGAPPPKLDPERIHWNGGSLGGIIGSMTVAVEPSIDAAVLEVPGGGFAHLVTTSSAKMNALIDLVVSGAFGVVGDERLDEYHPLVSLLAQTMEAGDPLAYAPHVFENRLVAGDPPRVLVTYARDDELLPNIATFALIRAFDMPIVGTTLRPVDHVTLVEPPAESGAVEYAPATHALGYARFEKREYLPGVPVADAEVPFPKLPKAIDTELPIREHADQIVHFLTQGEILVTAPPIPDFDQDGVLDADDAAPLDPAVQ